jgi:single-strand DNA-binding protein
MSANVTILGNLGGAPEPRYKPDGTFMVSFSIASNSVRNSPNGKIEETNWLRVTALGNQARTLVKYAKKGTRLLVQGKLTFNPWMNREEVPQVGADVLLQDFQFAGGGEKAETSGGASANETIEHSVETEIVSDVQEIEPQPLSY